MARASQEAIDTFISITGASDAIALQKLEEHGGDLNEAVNSYFNEGDRNIVRPAPVSVPEDDFMAIDDDPIRNVNPYSLLNPDFLNPFHEGRGRSEFSSARPWVTHPREVREIPIEFKDENGQSSRSGPSGPRPAIEDVTGTAYTGPEIRGNVLIDDEDDEILPTAAPAHPSAPSAPGLDNVTHYRNDIEEEMIQAAIEASKREVLDGFPNQQFGAATDDSSGPASQQRESHGEDTELERAVSLSLKTAEQEAALRIAEKDGLIPSEVEELGRVTALNGRQGFGSLSDRTPVQPKMEVGSSSLLDEGEDTEEQPLVRQRSRRVSSGSDSAKESSELEDSSPSSPRPHESGSHPQPNGNAFPSNEWGGISSQEHDEAVMLEAAIFGGISDATAYPFGYPPQQSMQTGPNRGFYPQPVPRPPSPTLTAQRLLREQQDDEYLASLQADREKELKAMEEAEARRLVEQAVREADLEEERKREEESQRKLQEEEEIERQLAAKEASLPREPAVDDENSVNLLVRMPDGGRRGRRFLKFDKLQSLFDFIDVGRGVKPGTYRLVRPYPRRAFSDGESKLSLSDLGLTSKQEALFLELI